MNRLFRRAVSVGLLILLPQLPAAALSPLPPPLAHSNQLVVVVTDDWDATQGKLQAYTRGAKGWQPQGPAFDVAIGRKGSAWGLGLAAAPMDGPQKQEGDGRSPAGVFAIGSAFGYAAKASTGLTYLPMQQSSYCMDVPASPYYNQVVDAREVGAEAVKDSTEPMRLDLHNKGDVRYQQGFIIAHNAGNEPGRGSCIFAHLWRQPAEATAGCTAMTAAHMRTLLAWLKDDAQPRFVLLPRAQYLHYQDRWQLPALTGALR
ncbi:MULTISPECIES: L,D-transpeptidase family protein [Stenotrophomonas]|uniref:L,D-transpeptidase family protein n=1 Tax=Stenotrophomonas TaxID=40323 RepID=UPI000D53CC49|nr:MULTISPECIES: L,D-transpeptidase family protein [Stenotrophomonas]AWH27797.1 hypothetical protein C1931_01945 [Stenotrophomonas sp. YAU14A_MKIMI4_1]AWH31740.1 hypothetical protein C1930_02045 [Stenotrophomonas sp. SAU14A_NAIMI4_8]